MKKKYRSDALAAVHETALGLSEAGVMGKRTMKAFDEMCLTPVGDPPLFLGYLSGVPEIYGADTRPKKLEWMIRQAKSLSGK